MNFSYYSWPENTLQWSECTGANAKSTLVMALNYDTGKNLDLLKKILQAVDLDFDQDIHFLTTTDRPQVQLLADPHLEKYRRIVLFGIQPTDVGIEPKPLPGCKILCYEKSICIAAPALADIATKPDLKKQLWSALKEVFHRAE